MQLEALLWKTAGLWLFHDFQFWAGDEGNTSGQADE